MLLLSATGPIPFHCFTLLKTLMSNAWCTPRWMLPSCVLPLYPTSPCLSLHRFCPCMHTKLLKGCCNFVETLPSELHPEWIILNICKLVHHGCTFLCVRPGACRPHYVIRNFCWSVVSVCQQVGHCHCTFYIHQVGNDLGQLSRSSSEEAKEDNFLCFRSSPSCLFVTVSVVGMCRVGIISTWHLSPKLHFVGRISLSLSHY